MFSEGLQLSVEEAYAVQLEVARLRRLVGERVAGYKVGCTGPNIREQFGMDGPISGFVWEEEIHQSQSTVSAAAYASLAIEGEVAARIGADGQATALFPVIELHNHVFRGNPRTLQELIANNGIHAGVVLADTSEMPWSVDRPIDGRLEILINDRLAEEGSLAGVPGGPAGSLRWLNTHLEKLGLSLVPGQIILTGAPLSLISVVAGDSVRVIAEGLGTVSVQVVS